MQQVTKNEKGEEQVKDIQGVDDYLENAPGMAYDVKTDDPAFRFVAPADGTYRIAIRNLSNYSQPDPRFVYRLAIHAAKPDFRLVAKPRLLPFSAGPEHESTDRLEPAASQGGHRGDGRDGFST